MRGRRSTRGSATVLEGTFDHGEEGYGLWLDPAIEDNPVYAEHWAGHRPVEVAVLLPPGVELGRFGGHPDVLDEGRNNLGVPRRLDEGPGALGIEHGGGADRDHHRSLPRPAARRRSPA